MKTKFDDSVKRKVEGVEIQPSINSWEMIQLKLDNQKKARKIIFFKYAASLVVLISISVGFFTVNSINSVKIADNKIKEKIVVHPVDSIELIQKAIINPVLLSIKKVKPRVSKKKNCKTKPAIVTNNNIASRTEVIANKVSLEVHDGLVSFNDKKPIVKIDSTAMLASNTSSKKLINAKDLLYSVTHSEKENQEYFVENISKSIISKSIILDTISSPSKLHNDLYNPESILAQVETELMIRKYKPNDIFTKLKAKVNKVIVALNKPQYPK